MKTQSLDHEWHYWAIELDYCFRKFTETPWNRNLPHERAIELWRYLNLICNTLFRPDSLVPLYSRRIASSGELRSGWGEIGRG
jgi:hypothetical protein